MENKDILFHLISTFIASALAIAVGGWIFWKWQGLSQFITGVKKLPERMDRIEKEMGIVKKTMEVIKEALLKHGFVDSFVRSKSPKEITETGKKFIDDHNLKNWLDSCPLISDLNNCKDEDELDVYLKCKEWVTESEPGRRKLEELMYKTDFLKQPLVELLTVAIRDRILKEK